MSALRDIYKGIVVERMGRGRPWIWRCNYISDHSFLKGRIVAVAYTPPLGAWNLINIKKGTFISKRKEIRVCCI